MTIYVKSIIFIHTNGVLLTAVGNQMKQYHYIEMGFGYDFNTNHELLDMIDYDGESCNDNINYR